jgi:hypothetical protein
VSVKRRASGNEGVIGTRDGINSRDGGKGEEKDWQPEEPFQRQGATMDSHTLAIFESMLDVRSVPLNGRIADTTMEEESTTASKMLTEKRTCGTKM